MQKKEFISKLQKLLLERGYPQDVVAAEMIPVSAYFDENEMKDIDVPVESMADEIGAMLDERKAEEAQKKTEAQDDIEAALLASGADLGKSETEKPEEKERISPVARVKEKAKKPAEEKKKPVTAAEPEKKEEPVQPAVPAEDAPKAPEAEKESEPAAETEEEEYSADAGVENVEQFAPKKPEQKERVGLLSRLILKIRELTRGKKPAEGEVDASEYDDGKNKVLFWVIFAIVIPIVLALALLIVAIYVAFWIVLALLMILLVAALVVFVFGGATVALVGIIYGVIMIIKGLTPVGLYEIGLGVTVGAAVLFVGILVYNFAIRLIPFGMRMLAKILVLALKRGKEGMSSLKKTIKSI